MATSKTSTKYGPRIKAASVPDADWAVASDIADLGPAEAAGTADKFTRGDHIHALPWAGTGDIADVGPTEAAGTAATTARGDHVHAVPGYTANNKISGFDEGHLCVGYFYLTGNVADANTVTINSRVYEFDDNATITGDVTVDVTGDLTPDAAITALVAAINADASRSVDAVGWTGNTDTTAGCSFIAKARGATNFTLAKSAANGTVSAAALVGAAAATARGIWRHSYTVQAADVTAWARVGGNEVAIGGVASTTAPTLVGFLARESSGSCISPANIILRTAQANTNFYVVLVEDPGAALAAGDILTLAAVV